MPRLLDLYCGAGGTSWGYHLAGFSVTGVDLRNQPNYPFEFIHMNALDFIDFDSYDLVHASPPCQAYSRSNWRGREYPKLIDPTRELLISSGLPYIIENVRARDLRNPTKLCGTMFHLSDGRFEIRRHRFFETSFTLSIPPYEDCGRLTAYSVYGNGGTYRQDGQDWSIPITEVRELIGITWMTVKELSQAIPPAYTEWIGRQYLADH